MADADDSLIFDVDIDPAKYNAKLDEMINKLGEASKAHQDAAAEVAAFEKSIKDIEDEMVKLTKVVENLDKTSKTYAKDMEDARKKAEALVASHENLNKGLDGANKSLNGAKGQVDQYKKAIGELGKGSDEAGENIKKFGNKTDIADKVVGKLKGNIVNLAKGFLTGIAGTLAAYAIPKLIEFAESLTGAEGETEKMRKTTKETFEVFEAAGKAVGTTLATLDEYKRKLNDANLPAAERLKIAKEYNKTADEQNKIDLKNIDNLKAINEQIEKQTKLVIQRAIAQAALNKLGVEAGKFVEAQLKFQQAAKAAGLGDPNAAASILDTFGTERTAAGQGIENSPAARKRLAEFDEKIKIRFGISSQQLARINTLRKERDEKKKDFEELGDILDPLITVEGLTTKPPPGKTQKIVNEYIQMLRELLARLRAASKTEFQSEELIVTDISNKLADELEKISAKVKEGKLTKAQGLTLQGILNQIFQADQDKAIADFKKRSEEAIKQINEAIIAAQNDATNARIANIQGDLDREAAAIAQQFDVTAAAIIKKRDELLKKVDEDVKKGLIKPAAGKEKKGLIAAIFDQILGEAQTNRDQKFEDLVAKQFEEGIQNITASFDEFETGNAERAARRIKAEQTRFMAGEINYKTFQKRITQILKDEADERRAIRRKELVEEFKLVNQQLDRTSDPDERKKLEARVRNIRKEVADIDKQVDKEEGDDKKKKLDTIVQYANAIGALTQQIVAFWQQTNEAEQRALERSINLQEKRVEAARRVAERGNAEYLQLEEERLRELELKRENAARRELAINAVLQTSQALVAFTSALAQGIATGGPLGGIAIAAAVIGLLASGYAIVKSLQPDDSQRLAEGTTSVQRRGAPAGVDTIPAMLNEGEAVIPTDTNRAYKPAIEAIYNRSIPATEINKFVNLYRRGATAAVNYDALGEASNTAIGSNGRIYAVMADNNRKLDEQNSTLKRMNRQLHKLGVNVTLDKNGFSLTMIEAARQLELNKKA